MSFSQSAYKVGLFPDNILWGWLIFLSLDINELCTQENIRFQCLPNYLSNDQSLFFSCPKSKQQPLVIWGGGRNLNIKYRGHENKCKDSNGPIPTMTSWQNAMTSAFHYQPYLDLLHYYHTFLFLLGSCIFWRKD